MTKCNLYAHRKSLNIHVIQILRLSLLISCFCIFTTQAFGAGTCSYLYERFVDVISGRSLTSSEIKAMFNYKTTGYAPVNSGLYHESKEGISLDPRSELGITVTRIRSAISKQKPTELETRVSHGYPLRAGIETPKVGDTFANPTFVSVSRNLKFAQSWVGDGKTPSVVAEIILPAGTRDFDMSKLYDLDSMPDGYNRG